MQRNGRQWRPIKKNTWDLVALTRAVYYKVTRLTCSRAIVCCLIWICFAPCQPACSHAFHELKNASTLHNWVVSISTTILLLFWSGYFWVLTAAELSGRHVFEGWLAPACKFRYFCRQRKRSPSCSFLNAKYQAKTWKYCGHKSCL